MFDVNVLKGLSVEEYKAIREALSTFSKEVKEGSKALDAIKKEQAKDTVEKVVRAAIASGALKVGVVLKFTLKGETRESAIVKVGDASFTVSLPEGVRYIRFASVILTPEAPKDGADAAPEAAPAE